jgi:hypothetical protein
MFTEIAEWLLAESLEGENTSPQGKSAISDKVANTYFPHLLNISQQYGIPVESLVDTWEGLVEGYRIQDLSAGLDKGALNRFIRASLTLRTMLGPVPDES